MRSGGNTVTFTGARAAGMIGVSSLWSRSFRTTLTAPTASALLIAALRALPQVFGQREARPRGGWHAARRRGGRGDGADLDASHRDADDRSGRVDFFRMLWVIRAHRTRRPPSGR